MDEVIIDFDRDENSKAFITAGSFYVAITRVTNGSKLWLRNFSVTYIQTDPLISYTINTMRDHYPYTMKKRYLREDIFTEESVKVGYLNINGLMSGYHAEYVNGDYNLQNLDILVGPFWAILNNFRHFGPVWPFLPCWAILCHFEEFFAILGQFRPFSAENPTFSRLF